MKTPSIYVATPMYGGQCFGMYAYGVLALLGRMAHKGWSWDCQFLYNESLITRARDNLAHAFLQTNHTHLLFLDADIGFNPDHIIELVEADKDIVGGCYPKKHIDWHRVQKSVLSGSPVEALPIHAVEYVFHPTDRTKSISPLEKELVEVDRLGTGYMLIKREVFEKLKPHTPTYLNNDTTIFSNDLVHQFFATSINPETNQLMSEDYHFCDQWKKIGGQIWIAPWCTAVHAGTYHFGNPRV